MEELERADVDLDRRVEGSFPKKGPRRPGAER